MEEKKKNTKKKPVTKTDKVNKNTKVKEVKEAAVEEETVKAKKVETKKSKVEKAPKNKIKFETTEQAEVKKFLIVILVVLLCVGAIYFFTRAFVSKDLFKKDEPKTEEVTEGEINYDIAIMGQILNRPYDEYYVIIYNSEEGEFLGDMGNIVYEYSQKEDKKKDHMYRVDLANELNKSYYDPKNENKSAKTLEEIKLGEKTLLKIKKNKKTGKLEINKYITDIDAMKKELGIKDEAEDK